MAGVDADPQVYYLLQCTHTWSAKGLCNCPLGMTALTTPLADDNAAANRHRWHKRRIAFSPAHFTWQHGAISSLHITMACSLCALKWDNTASNYYVSAHWETWGPLLSWAEGGGRARHKANCLLTHSCPFHAGCWLLHSGLSVSSDSAASKVPTRKYAAVALVVCDCTYLDSSDEWGCN